MSAMASSSLRSAPALRLGLRTLRPNSSILLNSAARSNNAGRLLSTYSLMQFSPRVTPSKYAAAFAGARSLSLLSGKSSTETPATAPAPANPTPAEENATVAASSSSTQPVDPTITPVASDAAAVPPAPDVAAAAAVPAPVSTPDASSVITSPTDLSSALSTIPPPLEYGDLAELGLISWTPAGLVRWFLEILNVTTGLPWFYTIMIGTMLSRAALIPLVVKSTRNAALMRPLAPKLAAAREEAEQARLKGDMLAMQQSALRARAIMQQSGVNPLTSLVLPVVQVPLMMGFFFGIKKMCELPVQQLKDSGFWLLQDLTVADPTYTLPLLSAFLINGQIKLSMKDLDLSTNPNMAHYMNGFRLFSWISVPFFANLPAGVMLTVTTGVVSVIIQNFILQQPAVRTFLRLPQYPAELPRMPSMLESLRKVPELWQQAKEQDALARQQKAKAAAGAAKRLR